MYILFGKETDNYHLTLGIDTTLESSIPSFKIQSITFVEEMGNLSPTLNVKFFDQVGHTIYFEPVMPNYTFILTLGKNKETSFSMKMKMTNISYESTDASDMKNMLVSIDLISEHWEKLYKVQKSRSFTNKSIHNILAEISREVGFKSTDIEKTSKIQSFIQPYWTNAKFIDWLNDHAATEDRRYGFTFFVNREDKFSFKTYGKMYSSKEITKLEHSANVYGSDDTFSMPKIVNNYVPFLRNGGFGIQHIGYDYSKKEYVREVVSPDIYKSAPLSTHHMIANEHISSEMVNYSGRDFDKAVSNNNLVKSLNNVQAVEIVLRGREDLNIGGIVNLVMPVSADNATNDVVNHIYGGKWLINRLSHTVVTSSNDYSILCRLTRNGINLPPQYDDNSLLKAR